MTMSQIHPGMTVLYQGQPRRVTGTALLPTRVGIVYLSGIDGFVLARDCQPAPEPKPAPAWVKTE